jgi:cobalt-zinc-cadmium efflux system outer membrane protein
MIVNRFVVFSSIFAHALAAGIAREKEEAFQSVQQSVQERTGKAVRLEEDRMARERALRDVRQVLRNPLTVDSAVQIALLNNRSLQATFEEIGLSAADVLEAATIPNPRFDLAVRFPDKPPSGTYVDYNAAIDFLSIIMIPLKKRAAKDQLESAALRVADDTLELISQVKSAFYSMQASQQLLQRFKLIVDANAASLDLAQRQHEAGNISDLALIRQQATYSRSRLDVAATEAEIRRNREKLNRLLGLWGPDTAWQISSELPEVPSSEFSMRGLERLAISQRLDLQSDYLRVASQAKNLGLTKSFRLLGALDFGVESERETDSQTRTGPRFAIELPVFNQGQARIARGEAALRQAQDKFEALAIDVRSQIRELQDELASKRQIALFYQEELIPDQRRILKESLINYNAMEIGDFELFTTKAEEARSEREYLEAVRDYWITRAELERAVGGNLNVRQAAEGKSPSVSNPRAIR